MTEPGPLDKLSVRTKLFYGVGDVGNAVVNSAVQFYLLLFYTDGALITPALAGTALGVVKIWDMINDSLFGWLSGQTTSRFGKRRVYMIFGAVQYDIPVVYVVANKAGWIAIRDLQAAIYGEERALGAEFLENPQNKAAESGEPISPHLTSLAHAFGCYAERVSAPDLLQPALERAFAAGKPAVVEVMVERTYPLSGSPAVGWWDVPVPAYLGERRARYERERAEEQ